ncbi:ion transporter [Paraflavisolibacter sp. H34]|uniref:ion transporter n=1 Tax=Huijunlia imazamoxiresistens TaxID=3127457 RepID=UPI003018EBC1
MTSKPLTHQRNTLLYRLEQLLEGPLVFLGFVWLVLLVIELTHGLSPALELMSMGIWVVFILDFVLKLLLAPKKLKFLKKNWLTVLSLVIPAFRLVRVVRVVRLLRGLRGVRLVKVVASLNRGMRSLGATMRRRGVRYVFVLTLLVLLAGAAGMFAFEKEVQGGLQDYGQALWWTAMMLTTSGSEYWPQSAEGRALCFLLALYAFSIFGYITATLASFFVGRDAEEKEAPVAGADDIAALRRQVEQLTHTINDLRTLIEKQDREENRK